MTQLFGLLIGCGVFISGLVLVVRPLLLWDLYSEDNQQYYREIFWMKDGDRGPKLHGRIAGIVMMGMGPGIIADVLGYFHNR
jgi:hypothetical protein